MKNQTLLTPDSAPGLPRENEGVALWRKSPFLYTVALRENRQSFRSATSILSRNQPLQNHINFRVAIQSEV